ncbi:hypothetical protein LCGC14_1830170 [marine sediment metagenome]|uniref:Uncharacterized protein n=1 Tax=marine sediment metagenome TaxID=412755 RepID=A0A0F9JFX7_9ZZZZ
MSDKNRRQETSSPRTKIITGKLGSDHLKEAIPLSQKPVKMPVERLPVEPATQSMNARIVKPAKPTVKRSAKPVKMPVPKPKPPKDGK